MSGTSARGLFRSTGNTSVHIVKTFDGFERTTEAPREEHDFYPTPPEVTRALLAYEGDRLRALGSVWEPACGDGAMAREIEAFGLPVIASDMIDRGCRGSELRSFYDFSITMAPAIVTNPPYCEINARDGKGKWLEHAMSLGAEYVAFFLNADWHCASGLAPLLERHPISRVYSCRWKVDFTGKGSRHNATLGSSGTRRGPEKRRCASWIAATVGRSRSYDHHPRPLPRHRPRSDAGGEGRADHRPGRARRHGPSASGGSPRHTRGPSHCGNEAGGNREGET